MLDPLLDIGSEATSNTWPQLLHLFFLSSYCNSAKEEERDEELKKESQWVKKLSSSESKNNSKAYFAIKS